MAQDQYRKRRRLARQFVVLGLASFVGAALAQQAPDAGTLLRDQPKPPALPKPAPSKPAIEKPAAKPEAEGPRILVKAIRFKGNTLISEAELANQVRNLVGKQASFRELQNAALSLIGFYAERGYLARVFLPPQEIKDGVVEFQVVEGVRGKLNIERNGERVDTARVGRFIDQRLAAGASMDIGELGEALNILNEQPGVQVDATIAPGEGERDIALRVNAADRPLVGVNLGLNNQGSRATGTLQGSAGLTLANPTGNFDAVSLLLNKSDGTTYGRGEYSLAVGDRGLRLGVNASSLKYHLVQSNFSALQSNGTATTGGLTASYPLARRTGFGLSVTGSADRKKLVDRTVAGETGNRIVGVANIGLSGYTGLNPDFIGGVLTFGGAVTGGNVDQRNAGALAADQAGRRTQGSFAKLSGNLGLLRSLDSNWTLTGSLRGQLPSKNLDSTERFPLGGPSGVRAYPVGEASGDAGWLFNLALTREVGDGLRLGAFYDAGGVKLNHTIPPAGIATPNRYTLQGAGLSLDWLPSSQVVLSVMLAAPLGNNPGKDANGLNVDGSKASKPRAWLSLAVQF